MSGLTLYALTGQFKALERLADEDIPEEAIRDTLEGLTGEIEIKATNVVKFAQHLEAFGTAVDQAAKAMKDRAARIERRVQSLHDYIRLNMEACGITKIDSPEFTISVVKNPPACLIDDEAQVPEHFKVTPPPPPARCDKKAIADAIKTGLIVPGAHLETSTRLKVRI